MDDNLPLVVASRPRQIVGAACSVASIAVLGYLFMLALFQLAFSAEDEQQLMLLLLSASWTFFFPIFVANAAVWITIIDVLIRHSGFTERAFEVSAMIVLFSMAAVPYYWWRELVKRQT